MQQRSGHSFFSFDPLTSPQLPFLILKSQNIRVHFIPTLSLVSTYFLKPCNFSIAPTTPLIQLRLLKGQIEPTLCGPQPPGLYEALNIVDHPFFLEILCFPKSHCDKSHLNPLHIPFLPSHRYLQMLVFPGFSLQCASFFISICLLMTNFIFSEDFCLEFRIHMLSRLMASLLRSITGISNSTCSNYLSPLVPQPLSPTLCFILILVNDSVLRLVIQEINM